MSPQSNTRDRISSLSGRRVSVLVVLIIASVGLVLIDPNALCVVPALLLLVPLLLRRYPGELLLAVRRVVPRHGAPDLACVAPGTRRPLVRVARGGLLIARSLAVRPPPQLFPAS